jgi:hypothetical protein
MVALHASNLGILTLRLISLGCLSLNPKLVDLTSMFWFHADLV